MNKRKLFAVFVAMFLFVPFAEAGIVRHFVKPVVKGAVHVGVKVVTTTAHVAKTIVY
jgi:hypothetical protein